ncbi:MAG: ribonuclease P protein subunit [Nanoarchaeota archaeon]|nr:ribonuclease P protein subunit [Nanoarchaeota archaeon]MBU4241882.1 ribonuclease P protein subunit [Nanoarchaeota archaeon]MBU4352470.1 ribonuclease P protein subunit [Nanoarchaeota archaeon]MBU4456001.1 ribonuclease P protein subunit [Nanoarchaeota archaeon]MCG2719420.1 ribonuclease P protein subunit [Nanoarchaeota archaeon]
MINPQNLTKHELIGLEIKVVESTNKSLVGKQGTIVDETKNTLTIKKNGKETKLLKTAIIFETEINGTTVQVDGKEIAKRPEDRIKK